MTPNGLTAPMGVVQDRTEIIRRTIQVHDPPLPRVRISMAKTSRFWPVSMSYFCTYLGCTR
jgi:hypothetical protein